MVHVVAQSVQQVYTIRSSTVGRNKRFAFTKTQRPHLGHMHPLIQRIPGFSSGEWSWPLHALMVWTSTEVPFAKFFDFWLVINEGPPFVDGHCRVPLRGHKSGDIQKHYCSSKPVTLLPFARWNTVRLETRTASVCPCHEGTRREQNKQLHGTRWR